MDTLNKVLSVLFLGLVFVIIGSLLILAGMSIVNSYQAVGLAEACMTAMAWAGTGIVLIFVVVWILE